MSLPRASLLPLAALTALASVSCNDAGFGAQPGHRRLVVELQPPSNPGTRAQPLALAVGKPATFRIVVRALDDAGDTDPSFNSFVRLQAKPGAIAPVTAPGAEGRNITLKAGASDPVDVQLSNAYGTTYILAEDLGYQPVDPLANPPPACANGIDDDGDGAIDFPADEGCAFANDDTETGGSYQQGQSPPLFFKRPRIADVRGLTCDPINGCSGNGTTPYPRQPINLDTGFHDGSDGQPQGFAFNVVVTRISSSGFYVADPSDTRGGFNAIFAFNFSPPPGMRVCDRIKSLGGTANEFFGFTQLSYPTWTIEPWDPATPCPVPQPINLTPPDLKDTANLLRVSASLVRVETLPDRSIVTKVTPKLGPGNVPRRAGGVYTPGPDASNCDYNGDGKIDFSDVEDPAKPDPKSSFEGDCSKACTADPECSEYSDFKSRSQFRLTVSDANGQIAAVLANASASTTFDPIASKGKEIRAFTGTMTYFSGGAQYTIEARCKDDIIEDLAAGPLPPDKACVFPRTIEDQNPQ